MNKFELLCTMLVLIADIIVIMIIGAGGKMSLLWTNVLLFVNGMAVGNIFYVLVFQKSIENMFRKGKNR